MKKRKQWQLHVLLIPAVLYLILFAYLPLFGVIIAFKDYNPIQGVFGSPFVGLDKFTMFFDSYYFWPIIKNTLAISGLSLLINTPIPIIFALLLNEVKSPKMKSVLQTISYAPYFISIVVLVGLINTFLNMDTGVANEILSLLHIDKIDFLGNDSYFRTIFVGTGVWQSMGWWSIIYLGTLSNVDPSLHEAAVMDGANRWQRILHINFPALIPVATILFILAMGQMMNVGFEKIYLMQNQSNLEVSEVIATYTYRVSFLTARDFSFGTAIGLFNSVFNIILLVLANTISNRVNNQGLW
jgi:putative aldouronate transport system permease protein